MSNLQSLSNGTQVATGGAQTIVQSTPQGVIFYDDFETGDLSHTDSNTGANWLGTKKTQVSNNIAKSGKYSLEFTYGTGTAPEQRFALGSSIYPEIWMVFDIYYPDGSESFSARYFHADVPGSDNNKFFRLWENAYNDTSVKWGASTWPRNSTDGTSKVQFDYIKPPTVCRQLTPVGPVGPSYGLILGSDLGKWMKIKIQVKLGSSYGVQDGVIKMWKNNQLIIEKTDLASSPVDNCPKGFTFGYLLGSNNAEFSAVTRVYIDKLTISASDPEG